MSRAFLIVLDSVGVGGAPDAPRYRDLGADTIGHIATRCARRDADKAGVRQGGLNLPFLASLGLGEACRSATGRAPPGWNEECETRPTCQSCRKMMAPRAWTASTTLRQPSTCSSL